MGKVSRQRDGFEVLERVCGGEGHLLEAHSQPKLERGLLLSQQLKVVDRQRLITGREAGGQSDL